MSAETSVCTACPGWGDHECCVLKTVVKDGKILRTERLEYTGEERDEGYICQKGIVSCRQPYNNERLTHPLKRVGERGEGKWETISWDQALDEIAEQLLRIREEYGPQSLLMWESPASNPPNFGLGYLLSNRFLGLWGATDGIQRMGIDNGPFYAGYYDLGHGGQFIATDPANFDSTDYLIVWGCNPIENQQRIAKHIVEAKDRGAKIVDVGLIFDGTAGFADLFIPVKPSTDAALALSMAHYIIAHKLYDKEFLATYTVAPFLVRDDNDLFLRDDEGNYLIWDEASNAAVAVMPKQQDLSTYQPSFLGEREVNDIRCRPAFERLEQHTSLYTPEYQEKITGVPANTVEKVAREYAQAEKAYIVSILGMRYQNQGETYRSLYLLGMLTGNMGRDGAGVTAEVNPCGWPLRFNDNEILFPEGIENLKTSFVPQTELYEQIRTGKPYPIKAFWKAQGNPVQAAPNRVRWLEDVAPNLELIVDVDIWLTDTGAIADYVLPDCMPFERKEIISDATYNHIVLQKPAIEPQGEAREPSKLYYELAKRVGLGDYFDKTTDEWLQIRLNSEWPFIAAIDPPLTLERLEEENMVRAAVPPMKYDPFSELAFSTPSGRMEFYSERLAPIGHQIAGYYEPYEVPTTKLLDTGEEYPYQYFTGRQRFFMQTMFREDPLMAEMAGGKPVARVNPLVAEQEGLKTGDLVEVYNQRGHVQVPVKIDEAIPPGTVQVWYGWRSADYEKGAFSELLVPISDPSTITEAADLWWNHVVSEGGIGVFNMGSVTPISGCWDTLWDCACAIKKIEA